MKIWDLKVIDLDSWPHLTLSCIVIAPTEFRARQVASQGCDGENDWLDPKFVECRETIPEEFECDCLLITSDLCPKCEE